MKTNTSLHRAASNARTALAELLAEMPAPAPELAGALEIIRQILADIEAGQHPPGPQMRTMPAQVTPCEAAATKAGERRTYFGLLVHENGLINLDDIKQLPFYAFWLNSAAGSTMPVNADGEWVYRHDWEAFARLFIRTGRHRISAMSADG
jgi:hypothetical protein